MKKVNECCKQSGKKRCIYLGKIQEYLSTIYITTEITLQDLENYNNQ